MVLDQGLRLAAFLKPLNRGTSTASIDTARQLSTSWEAPQALLKTGLYERLRKQMFEENTFIVRKDGVWGILFEVEFCCAESEADRADPNDAWFSSLLSYDEQVRNLVAGMQAIAGQFPLVQFAVPESEHIYQGRPAVWAFVADGLLNSEQREALGRALQVL